MKKVSLYYKVTDFENEFVMQGCRVQLVKLQT